MILTPATTAFAIFGTIAILGGILAFLLCLLAIFMDFFDDLVGDFIGWIITSAIVLFIGGFIFLVADSSAEKDNLAASLQSQAQSAYGLTLDSDQAHELTEGVLEHNKDHYGTAYVRSDGQVHATTLYSVGGKYFLGYLGTASSSTVHELPKVGGN